MGNVIDISALRDDLAYDPETGVFTWRHGVVTGNGAFRLKPGQVAGTNTGDGLYRQFKWRGHLYRAHRLAWLYVHGEWPVGEIDHINRDGRDNRIANLRLATRAQNLGNTRRRTTNQSGFKGVTWSAHAKRWSAWIATGGNTRHLGYFDTPEAAHQAYANAAKTAFGEFARAA